MRAGTLGLVNGTRAAGLLWVAGLADGEVDGAAAGGGFGGREGAEGLVRLTWDFEPSFLFLNREKREGILPTSFTREGASEWARG